MAHPPQFQAPQLKILDTKYSDNSRDSILRLALKNLNCRKYELIILGEKCSANSRHSILRLDLKNSNCRKYGSDIITMAHPPQFQAPQYIKANLHHITYHSDIHDYPTRNCKDVLPGFHRLSGTRKGTDYHCVKFFNVLPENVRALPDELFYAKIKTYLLRKAFYGYDEFTSNNFRDLT
nr:unnamed protein product [Callosobruchus analis]